MWDRIREHIHTATGSQPTGDPQPSRMVEVPVTFAAGHEPPSDPPYIFVQILQVVDGKETEEQRVWDRG